MLFTRCPDCDTTFRVTDDALRKANGQVRCGRCSSVFNAYAERRAEPGDSGAEAPARQAAAETPASRPDDATEQRARVEPPPSAATAPQPASAEPRPPAEQAAPVAPHPALRLVTPSPPQAPPAAPPEPDTDPLGPLSLASVVAQLEQGGEEPGVDLAELGDLEPAQGDSLPPTQIEAVLEAEPVGDWRHALKEPPRRSGWWSAGVAFGVVALALQLVNHYRAELVKQPSVGSLVQSAYAALGIAVLPRWDVRQYQILDWVATAEPSSGGIGSLRITARIKNLGPEYQPYPDVNLRLKDRWEAAVGGRVFAPAEYLAAAPRKLMAPGETARAQLELVDPGPDAYGFDLDVCVEVETHVLSCRNDKVFL